VLLNPVLEDPHHFTFLTHQNQLIGMFTARPELSVPDKGKGWESSRTGLKSGRVRVSKLCSQRP